MKFVNVFGLKFTGLTKRTVTEAVDNDIKVITTVNAEFIVKANETDDRLKLIINNTISTFDGQIPYLLARLLTLKKFEKISGSDIIFDFINIAKKEKKKKRKFLY